MLALADSVFTLRRVIIILSFFVLYVIFRHYFNIPVSQQKLTVPIGATAHLWGEPVKTMFPAINNPKYNSSDVASQYLKDSDEIYILRRGKEIFVYPAMILGYHHIINDTIQGKPIAVTLCLLSNTATTYNRTIGNKVLSLGVLGSLYYGNLVMYDTETNSYWLQLTGESFFGSLQGNKLTFFSPLVKSTWFAVKHDTNINVLPPVKDISFYREWYGTMGNSKIGLNSLSSKKNLDKRLDAFEKGIGIYYDNKAKFYRSNTSQKDLVINEVFAEQNLLVVYLHGSQAIFSRDVRGKNLNFVLQGESLFDKETGSVWNIQGTAMSGPLKGNTLVVPEYRSVYWYTWSAFFPMSLIYQ